MENLPYYNCSKVSTKFHRSTEMPYTLKNAWMLLKITLTSWLSSVTLPEILWYFSLCQTLPILYILFICYTGSLLQPHIQFRAGADLQCSETNHSFLPPSHGQALLLHSSASGRLAATWLPLKALLCYGRGGMNWTLKPGQQSHCPSFLSGWKPPLQNATQPFTLALHISCFVKKCLK